MPYDKDSGIVYVDKHVQAATRCRQHDPSFAKGQHALFKTAPKTGIKSLKQTAVDQFAANLNALEDGCLAALPSRIAVELYDQLKIQNLASLNAWKLFAGTPHLALSDFKWQVTCSCQPLEHFVDILRHPILAWTVNLTLRGSTWEESDIVHIVDLDNLKHLSIENNYDAASSSGCLTDRGIRTWINQVKRGKMQHLRTVKARGQPLFTVNGLQDLRCLPKLDMTIVNHCGIGHDSRAVPGWHSRMTSRRWMTVIPAELEQLIQSDCAQEASPAIDACLGNAELMYIRGRGAIADNDRCTVFVRDRNVFSTQSAIEEPQPIPYSTAPAAKRARLREVDSRRQNVLQQLIRSKP